MYPIIGAQESKLLITSDSIKLFLKALPFVAGNISLGDLDMYKNACEGEGQDAQAVFHRVIRVDVSVY